MKINKFLKKAVEAQKITLNNIFKTGFIVIGIGVAFLISILLTEKDSNLGLLILITRIFCIGVGLGTIIASLRMSKEIIAQSDNFNLMEDGAIKEKEEDEKEN